MAKYESFDDSDGVWRTIGGRKVFIRDGESVSSAMKRSGKFKSAKKKVDYDERPQSDVDRENERNNKAVEKIEKGKKDFDPNDFEKWREEVDPDYEMDDDRARLKYENYKDSKREGDKSSIKEMVKVGDNTYLPLREGESKEDAIKQHNERQKKYRENLEQEVSKNLMDGRRLWDQDLVDAYIDMDEEGKLERAGLPTKKFTRNMKNMEGEPLYSPDRLKGESSSSIKSQQSDIERASGLKVKQSFETDKFGTGKADRFQLEDGRYIEHSKESLGSKDDTWTINKVEKGTIKSEKFDSYDDMIKHLDSSSNKNIWKKEDATEIYDHLTKSEQNKMRQAYEDLDFYEKGTPAYKNAEDYIKRMDNEATKRFSQNNNTAYKKAFQEYKKQHPNSKLTLQKFIDMSEGK